ncbi:uncharacterized protein LOC141850030 [Brevipalpus obovatus]|uniref:uncharacterized protein LOC141850030 n=1 Tax=Brevipalpus obovatus TaxID=246614 RepID=UPI003D9E7549
MESKLFIVLGLIVFLSVIPRIQADKMRDLIAQIITCEKEGLDPSMSINCIREWEPMDEKIWHQILLSLWDGRLGDESYPSRKGMALAEKILIYLAGKYAAVRPSPPSHG